MTGMTHKIGGMCVGAAALELLGQPLLSVNGGLVFSGAVLGSLIPDLDHPGSTTSHRFRLASTVYGLGQWIIRLFSGFIPGKWRNTVRSLAGHRGLTHSLLLPAALAAALPFSRGASAAALMGLLAGVASYIVLDMLSGGAPLLLPFTGRRITLARIRTGGAGEACVRLFLMGAGIFLLYELLR